VEAEEGLQGVTASLLQSWSTQPTPPADQTRPPHRHDQSLRRYWLPPEGHQPPPTGSVSAFSASTQMCRRNL
jgi:hypothetical protein